MMAEAPAGDLIGMDRHPMVTLAGRHRPNQLAADFHRVLVNGIRGLIGNAPYHDALPHSGRGVVGVDLEGDV